MNDDEMIYMFHAESIDLLNDMEDCLLYIQKNGMDKENINAIFRAVHSIKGGAGMFDLKQLVLFSHTAESLLDRIRNDELLLDDTLITLFLNIKDHLNNLIENIITNEGKENYSLEFINKTAEYELLLQNYLDRNISKKVVEPNVVIEPIPIKENKKIVHQSTLKIESNKIDTLINLVGEMVITTASVMEHSTRIQDKDLTESVHILSRMLEELREASMKTRMIPVGDTFNRYKRVVRDLSFELDKEIDFIVEGSDTELDKTVIEKISDPLMHLIRNSIDHGIESSIDRDNKGKNIIATLKLKAFHEANNICIVVEDDGKGLNAQKIFDKAVEKNLIDSNTPLKDDEIYNLIMQPGFSTADSISNISGRGVGMDVVKRNIEELRGTIEIQSSQDVGMSVTIRLPLTLAIIDGFMVKISSDFYIIPLKMLLECIELTKEYKIFVSEHNFINLRDHVLPLLDLRDFFGYKKNNIDHKKENIVVVNFGTLKVGLIVDELLGEFQTVIKPMGKVFQNLKGIGGATILGDGTVSPILDIPILLEYANKQKYKGFKC